MAQSTHNRRREVLHAIVSDYIASPEPVGSKSLVERHCLSVSSATIRNDMAALEAEGYIVSQHASSGRIPTPKAYRLFVDSIAEVKPLSQAERTAILTFLEGGVDLEDVLHRSAQLLSQLTKQAAVVQLPKLEVTRVKHCEVVLLSPRRLLLVLISDSGRVDQRDVELAQPLEQEAVSTLRTILNSTLDGKAIPEARESLVQLANTADSALILDPVTHDALAASAQVLVDTLVEQPHDRLILAGTSNLTHVTRDVPQNLPTIIDALEQQVVMLKLLANTQELGQVDIRIGDENEEEGLQQTSVVTTSYGVQGKVLGGLGVVGPTFMDYSATMSKVAAVARYVSEIVGRE